MEGFGVVLIAVDDYPDPPGPLPSSASAARFGGLVGGARGGAVLDSVVATGEQDVVDALRKWATDIDRPSGSIVYLVGHGVGDGLDHSFLVPAKGEVVRLRTTRLAEFLQSDWQARQRNPASWTLFILDCCDSELGVTNLMAELAAKYPKRPKRLGLWPVAPGGASRSGVFVDAFQRALDTFTDNDEHLPLDAVFRKIRKELGDLEPAGFLPDDAALTLAGLPAPVVMSLDVHAVLLQAIDDRPPEVRSHFLAKARGSEVGEVSWHFSGREAETADLCTWLHSGSGMRVVTGEAGSGKSALLGHIVVLADQELVDLYIETGLAPQLAKAPRPPSPIFMPVVHLTGKTAHEVLREIAGELGIAVIDFEGYVPDFESDLQMFFAALPASVLSLRPQCDPVVLLDALDESQEPKAIAAFLQAIAASGELRVLVGTRASLDEGPDKPADPARRELLDALQVDDAEVLTLQRDSRAVLAYAEQRLRRDGSPYADHPRAASAIADRIKERDQPFLFARLATAELRARPALELDDPKLSELLGNGHQGVFAAALDRISAEDPKAFDMIHTLAYARGRGMPRTGEVWLDAARAVGGRDDLSDTDVDTATRIAAPYITLDAEASQSTYRLAHRTFVEHFQAIRGHREGHQRIAEALTASFEVDPQRWVTAGHYVVRYLPEHLVPDITDLPQSARFAELVTDAGWLTQAVNVLGLDRTVELISTMRTRIQNYSAGLAGATWPYMPEYHLGPVDPVLRALGRSRIALARDPAQLPGLLHARLKAEQDPGLNALGTRVGQITGHPWLQMVEGSLDWRADLETTFGSEGKARALAFGDVDNHQVVAIAIDTNVVMWDPRQGAVSEAGTIDLGDHRATAVAVASINHRTVVVTSAAYDGVTETWDAATGALLGQADIGLGHNLAVGPLGDRLVIAGSEIDGEVRLLDAVTLEVIEPGGHLAEKDVLAFAVNGGSLVALKQVPGDTKREHRIAIVDAADGSTQWQSSSVELPAGHSRFDAVAGGDIGSTFLVVAGAGGFTFWFTENDTHIEESAHSVPLRAFAVGSVRGRIHDRPVVASTPDYDGTVLVNLHEVRKERADGEATLYRPRVDGGTLVNSSVFDDDAPSLSELFPPNREAKSFTVDRPEDWPHTAIARGALGGQPVVVTGSVEGSAWVWDMSGDRPRPLAGPLAIVPPYILERGWEALRVKPAVATADSVAFGHHPDHGAIIAVACEGKVLLYTVPAGEPLESPAADASVIDAVDLGLIEGRAVLVTGSKGGVLGVWGLTPPERFAVLTLDDPITDVRVVADADNKGRQTIAVRVGRGGVYVVEIVQA